MFRKIRFSFAVVHRQRHHAAFKRRPARCLAAQKLTLPGGRQIDFPVDPFSKQCLLEGVDELGYILAQQSAIATFESTRQGSLNTLE